MINKSWEAAVKIKCTSELQLVQKDDSIVTTPENLYLEIYNTFKIQYERQNKNPRETLFN